MEAMKLVTLVFTLSLLFLPGVPLGRGEPEPAAPLPAGVRAVWDLDRAAREATPTRERVCLNGLWRWQPASDPDETAPARRWGYFKVPGAWPGITDYMQKDCQTVFAHPDWQGIRMGGVASAWYEREFTVPKEWASRRISLTADYVHSFASIWVDGKKAGEIRFPGGELDLTELCQPGGAHRLTMLVVAMPLKGVMLSYSDTFGAKQVKGAVERRGLCGDLFLAGTPAGPRVESVAVQTSVREWHVRFRTKLRGLNSNTTYRLRTDVNDGDRSVRQFESAAFNAADLRDDAFEFAAEWRPDKLWDAHTPQNQYQVAVSLLDATGRVLDTAFAERFGFREFWIDGRDFYLNGSRIFLCAVPLDNAQIGAAWATYEAARESLQRLKSFGVNFVYTHNYGCEPGTHLSFAEILRAADDEGMLVSFSQPHFGQYDWASASAEETNGYARHAAFYVSAAGNHPSVVCYSMSHNATGTEESMNPDKIDGRQDERNQWSANNARKALRAEAIVARLDGRRIIYHHSSGNLGSMHTANFYANFTPSQEMSDWFEHWATTGVKPLFLCEYGVPIFWDWMMYRGWYEGKREFGSARVPWELCLAEWNAQFTGGTAFQVTELEKQCLRWEANQFREGRRWHRWDYPRNGAASNGYEQRNQIIAGYLTENIRAFRTWGVSAFCPWDHGDYWRLRDGVTRVREELSVAWDRLQKPGFSPDYTDAQMEWMNTSFAREDWIPTAAGEALLRNNGPLLAYIAGSARAFTETRHNFVGGDTVEKQLIIVNNSRQTIEASCSWFVSLPKRVSGTNVVRVETGEQARLPLRWRLPEDTAPGRYRVEAAAAFNTGQVLRDQFTLDVLPRLERTVVPGRIAVFDPIGETAALLRKLGMEFATVEPSSDLSGYDLLIMGKGALTLDGPAPDVARIRDGLKVVLFEQKAEVLEKRLGFRTAEYGLRWVFKRVPDHPLLRGLDEEHLRDWNGEATLLPSRLTYTMGARHAPEVMWCGIPVTRAWRAGNRGNVASVLIEKPPRGNFLPVLDGGFGLEFSPLLECREGSGLVLFCQMDVTSRTEADPAAERLVRNLIDYAAEWKPAASRQVTYSGEPAGAACLDALGMAAGSLESGARLKGADILVVSQGAAAQIGATAGAEFLRSGGKLVAVGVTEEEARRLLPFEVHFNKSEHIATYFTAFGRASALAGISPAEVHNRDPRIVPLVTGGARPIGDGVLAEAGDGQVVLCQLAPWWFAGDQQNLRRTHRRTALLLGRLLANLGAAAETPLIEFLRRPVASEEERRWLTSYYVDAPREWDDPYRFFCW